MANLRQVDVLVSRGQSVADASRAIGVTGVTSYRWGRGYGGLKSDQVRRMKELETENQRLRKAIADLTLGKLILQEAARGNFLSIRGFGIARFCVDGHWAWLTRVPVAGSGRCCWSQMLGERSPRAEWRRTGLAKPSRSLKGAMRASGRERERRRASSSHSKLEKTLSAMALS